jgi:hypothetical protein
VKNVGASLVKQVANATNDTAGDGMQCFHDEFVAAFFLSASLYDLFFWATVCSILVISNVLL